MDEVSRETTEDQCPHLEQCSLIHNSTAATPTLVSRINKRYCSQSHHINCARFQVYEALGKDAVPELMLPNQIDWVNKIIEDSACQNSPEQNTVNSH